MTDQALVRHEIATASFRLCSDDDIEEEEDDDQAHIVQYTLTLTPCPLATEIFILKLLDTDGHLFYCTFHEEREPCVYRRPVSDLIQVWHPDKVEGGVFCLHVAKRGRRISEAEVKLVEREWKGKVTEIFGIDLEAEEVVEDSSKALGDGSGGKGPTRDKELGQCGVRAADEIGNQMPKMQRSAKGGLVSQAGSNKEQPTKPTASSKDDGQRIQEATVTTTSSDDAHKAAELSKTDTLSNLSALGRREGKKLATRDDHSGPVGAVGSRTASQVDGLTRGIEAPRTKTYKGEHVGQSIVREPKSQSKIIGWRGTATEVTISLRFVLDGTPLSPRIWQPITDIVVPRTTTMQDLPSRLLIFIHQLGAGDHALMADMREKWYRLTFVLKPELGDERDAYLDFTTGRVPFESVCDLLRDPHNLQESIAMAVEFSGTNVDKPISTVEGALQPQKNSTRRICLGTIHGRLTDQDRPDRIPTSVAIVGSIDMDKRTTMSLSIVPVFLLQNLVVGDAGAGDTLAFRSDYDWRDRFTGVKSKEELLMRVNEHVDDEGETDELPTALSYCFSRFADFGRLAAWPKDRVHITVRYVDLVPNDGTREGSMPTQQHFLLVSSDTPTSVHKIVLDRMAGTAEAKGLFSAGDVEKWRMVMFVLPQIEEMAKMFLWEEGSIGQFLGLAGNGTVGRLLVEAHVVAR
ncbi:hypothetical protein LTR78_008522 [Recurvomyces mirabilis]|uniref:Uncharacterized protein n=1 Tax=Recurvomyces mirabilis TaxID=574656 RepID=A0AAE0TT22_9PEZI|nr:hypothetical protein LTR78_008522 [Recurvomyces mirabilis]KAK5156273.1 hypothetical protein LTS14_005161 [Recurvomyces mirabilis]